MPTACQQQSISAEHHAGGASCAAKKKKCAVGVGNLDRKDQGGGEHVDRLGVLFVGCFST
jgi:hypothetical protein